MSIDGSQVENGGSLGDNKISEKQGNSPHSASERQGRFQLVVEEAQGMGLDERLLPRMVQTFSMCNGPIDTNSVAIRYSKDTGIPKDAILSLARNYAKEKTRASEVGDLYHYHQTSFGGFVGAAETGGLMSYNMLKDLGKNPSSSGSRPDVVQMTRDKYNGEGKLVGKGFTGQGIGAGGTGVALVFDESVMDLPNYDCLTSYPNAPTIPFDYLVKVLVNTEADKESAMEVMKDNYPTVTVNTKDEWTKSNYPVEQT